MGEDGAFASAGETDDGEITARIFIEEGLELVKYVFSAAKVAAFFADNLLKFWW